MAVPAAMMIEASSDTENSLGPVGLLVEQIVQEVAKGDAKLSIVELDDDTFEDGWTLDEQAYDADILKIESESIDLTQDDDEEISIPLPGGQADTNLRCEHYIKGARNACLCGHHDLMTDYTSGDSTIRKNNVHGLKVELRVGRFIVDFIEIKEIWVHRITSAVLFRGHAYTRTRNLDGRLQAYKNELCRLVEIDTNDARPMEEQSLVEVTFEDLDPKSRVLHITNKSFPECRFDPDVYSTSEERETLAPLTARWIHIMQYPDKRFRRAQRPIDGETLAHFMESDVLKARHRDVDSERLFRWRGETVQGGSYVSQNIDEQVSIPDGKTICLPKHRYNAADMFSGAGGYTAGAKRAGVKVVYALDHWTRCNATYKANHPEVELQEQDIMVYCNDLTLPDVRFDLVHLSPPCQTWSPAHTCAGKNDSANIAALYACTDIIFRFRPRIVTFEQTFGIIQERHLPWFNALVQSLTKHGYSLTWKVIRLVEYGLPQTRKRLIMIGAAPGEKLPPFPSPTHAAEPDTQKDGSHRQKKFVSAIKACWGLVPGMDLHDPAGVKQIQRQPWDGNQPMNRTITTSGGQAYHWDGERDLTLAEFARLQGFPEDYIFKAPCIKKQIGNAFPPTVVHAIMKQIVHSLELADNINSCPREQDVISIDDNDDEDDKIRHQSRDSGAPSPGHKREPEPDYPDYPGYFQDINHGLSEEEAIQIAMEESKRMTFPLGFPPEGDVSYSAYGTHDNNTISSVQNMTATDRAAWTSHIAQGGIMPQGKFQRRRRRSSGASSVVCTGQRQLTTIIEDDEDHIDEERGRGRGRSRWAPSPDRSCTEQQQEGEARPGSSMSANARQSQCPGESSSRQEIDEPKGDNGLFVTQRFAPRYAPNDEFDGDDSLFLPQPDDSPCSPTSHESQELLDQTVGTVSNRNDWSDLRPNTESRDTNNDNSQPTPPFTRHVTAPQFHASHWQENNLSEEEAMALAMNISIEEAIQLHEKCKERKRQSAGIALADDGLDDVPVGPSRSRLFKAQFKHSRRPRRPMHPRGVGGGDDGDSDEEVCKGKGKGKAVCKRSFAKAIDGGGGDEHDAENGSSSKRGRI